MFYRPLRVQMDKLDEEYWASGQAPGNFARVVREYEVRLQGHLQAAVE